MAANQENTLLAAQRKTLHIDNVTIESLNTSPGFSTPLVKLNNVDNLRIFVNSQTKVFEIEILGKKIISVKGIKKSSTQDNSSSYFFMENDYLNFASTEGSITASLDIVSEFNSNIIVLPDITDGGVPENIFSNYPSLINIIFGTKEFIYKVADDINLISNNIVSNNINLSSVEANVVKAEKLIFGNWKFTIDQTGNKVELEYASPGVANE